MNVTGVKQRVRAKGGEVTDVGYTAVGRARVGMVEAYFENCEEVPEFPSMEFGDRVTVDREWDAENNGAMFEVDIS